MAKKDSLYEEWRNYDSDKDYNGAYGISLRNRVIREFGSMENFEKFKMNKEKEKKSLENKLNFIKASDENDLDPNNTLDRRADKENIIRKYGFPQLNESYDPAKGDFLSQLNDEKLGKYFSKIYYSIKEQLSK